VVWLAVVEMISVAVLGLVDVMLTELVVPRLSVGVFTEPDGLVVMTAVSVTAALPVKLFEGVTVIVELLPVVAPAVTVTAVPTTVKTGVMAETVRATEAVAVV
jgi:hypothetical protein